MDYPRGADQELQIKSITKLTLYINYNFRHSMVDLYMIQTESVSKRGLTRFSPMAFVGVA